MAPENPELGCALAVNEVHKKAFGECIGGWSSTFLLYTVLLENKNFKEVNYPLPGDIIISPTGYGSGSIKHGHVGIVDFDGKIMSNNSSTGLWGDKWSVNSWNKYYNGEGGFPVKYYRKLI